MEVGGVQLEELERAHTEGNLTALTPGGDEGWERGVMVLLSALILELLYGGGLLEGMEGLVEWHCTNPVLHGEE